MDRLEMAKALMDTPKATEPGQTVLAYGTATADSANGLVLVDFGGDTVSPDDEQAVEVETTFAVRAGDEVIVSLVGADGTGKTPIVIGVIGRGDEQQTEITTAVQTAQAAQAAAENAITSQVNWYILSASAPATPTEADHTGWSTTEPVWSPTSSDSLYISVRTVTGDGTITWSVPALVQAFADINIARNAIISSVSETYVAQGESNIVSLSSTMKQDASGVSIYNDISSVDDTYAHIDGETFEIKAVSEANNINAHLDQSVASFGLNKASIAGIDGTKYWNIEDLRTGSGGTASMSQLFYGDAVTTDFVISFPFVSILSVQKNGTVQTVNTDYTVDTANNSVNFTTAPLVGDSILIAYTTTAPVFAYTNGLRGSGDKGPYSISSGLYNIARGAYSEAHGNLNEANGYASYVEGYNCIASGEMQRVFGKSNIEDTSNQYIEIVGNGSITAADDTESFLINNQATVTLAHTPEVVNTAYFGKTYLANEISGALTSHDVYFTYKADPAYDAGGNLLGYNCSTTLKATTPFDYAVTFVCKDNTASGNPKTITLGANQTASSSVSIKAAGVNHYSVYSATIPDTDAFPYMTIEADTVTISGPITYWGSEFGNLPLVIAYTYAGSMVRGNARTLDWNGNENIAGEYSTTYGIAPVFKLLWVNSAPTSNFAAQTIPLNLANYDAVCIITKTTTSSNYTYWQFGLVNGYITMANKSANNATLTGRTAEVDDTGITFSTGYQGSSTGTSYCIPVSIYGIKGIQTSMV